MNRSLRLGVLLASIVLSAWACGNSFSSVTGTGATAGAGGTTPGTGGAATSSTVSSGGSTSSAGGGAGGSSSTSSGTTTSTGSGTGGGGTDGGILGPTVQILHPGSGVDRQQGVSIYFHGIATDPTDGTLSGSALVWTDDLEGQFGTGEPVNWAPTMLGTHVMTLTATDSLNYAATSTVTFDIVP